jgi:hypothetical protein
LFTRLLALSIGYWSLYLVFIEVPTESIEELRRWSASLVFEPFVFVTVSLMSLVGIFAYGTMLKFVFQDMKLRSGRNLFQSILFGILLLLSIYFLYRLNMKLMLIILPCMIIYGIISISQTREIVRRQDGVE